MLARSPSSSQSLELKSACEGTFLQWKIPECVVILGIRLSFSSSTIEFKTELRRRDVWTAANRCPKILPNRTGATRKKATLKRQITNFEGGCRRDSRPDPLKRLLLRWDGPRPFELFSQPVSSFLFIMFRYRFSVYTSGSTNVGRSAGSELDFQHLLELKAPLNNLV